MVELLGRKLPDVDLLATTGAIINLSHLEGSAVVFMYPWTGKPGHPNPPNWDNIKGAHGSTPQALAYSKLYPQFMNQNIKVFGVSLQPSQWQQDFVSRNDIAFPLLSDAQQKLLQALSLEVFNTGGTDYLKRRTLVLRDAIVILDRQEVDVPELDAEIALHFIQANS